MIKCYKTNNLKSVTFYLSIFIPILIICFTIFIILNPRNNRMENLMILAFFSISLAPLEFLAIKNLKTEITIDDNGIQIKRGGEVSKTGWNEIKRFEVSLYNWGWELTYQLITTDKKILGFITKNKNISSFGDSVENCNDLIKEIENHTGLKLKNTV